MNNADVPLYYRTNTLASSYKGQRTKNYLFLKWQLAETAQIDKRESNYQFLQQKLSWQVNSLEEQTKKMKVKVTDANVVDLQ